MLNPQNFCFYLQILLFTVYARWKETLVSAAMPVDTYISLLQTFSGRDKIMRTAGYTAVLLTGAVKGDAAKKLTTFARQISASRTVLRLFDDIPMLKLTLKWAAEEKDLFSRVCAILGNLAIQIYYPFEHIAWLSDQEILSFKSTNLWGAGTLCWAICLFFSILKSIRQVLLLRRKQAKLIQQRRIESLELKEETDTNLRSSIVLCTANEKNEYLNLIKNAADFMLAINVLPWKGILWSGKFTPPKNAVFGTISSIVGLYMLVKSQSKSKAS